jgi:hypothetical protein
MPEEEKMTRHFSTFRSRPGRRAAALIACSAWLMLPAVASRAVVLDVPVDQQDNLSGTCGSCGSASTGMALAYLGRAHSADWIEGWLYARLPCGPGPDLLAAQARSYCATYLGISGCASNQYWSSGNVWDNLNAQIAAGRPFVASTYWPFSSGTYAHYVTVVGVEGSTVYVNEPAHGERQAVPWSTFNARWAANNYRVVIFHFGCAPGAVESRPCCDCGTQSRTCVDGHWGDWGGCAGPDPDGGNRGCETGECGPCNEGRVRCVDGCLACVRAYEPVPELCDILDNDCNCVVNDGNPAEMGELRPPWAARIVDVSYPSVIEEGVPTPVWLEILNEGTETWRPFEVWLSSESALEEDGSLFFDPETWPAWDVAALVSEDVAPGDTTRVEFDIVVQGALEAQMSEGFRLLDREGNLVPCPVPGFEMDVVVDSGSAADEPGVPVSSGDGEPMSDGNAVMDGGCACAFAY